MKINEITEENVILFIKKILTYNQRFADSPYRVKLITSKDELSKANVSSWYRYDKGIHRLYFNVPKIMYLAFGIQKGLIDIKGFYALVALIVQHEYRHLQQGKVMMNETTLYDFNSIDAYNMELMMYIRYFFDNYYLKNKAYVKYELDAEKFAVINGVNFLNHNIPKFNTQKFMVEAVNYLGLIQKNGVASATLPSNANSLKEIIEDIQKRMLANLRDWDLAKTLTVCNSNCYKNHARYGLNESDILTDSLSDAYFEELSGYKQDELIVNKIISSLDNPQESLEQFPNLQRKYNL